VRAVLFLCLCLALIIAPSTSFVSCQVNGTAGWIFAPKTLTVYQGNEAILKVNVTVYVPGSLQGNPTFVNAFVGALSELDLADKVYAENWGNAAAQSVRYGQLSQGWEPRLGEGSISILRIESSQALPYVPVELHIMPSTDYVSGDYTLRIFLIVPHGEKYDLSYADLEMVVYSQSTVKPPPTQSPSPSITPNQSPSPTPTTSPSSTPAESTQATTTRTPSQPEITSSQTISSGIYLDPILAALMIVGVVVASTLVYSLRQTRKLKKTQPETPIESLPSSKPDVVQPIAEITTEPILETGGEKPPLITEYAGFKAELQSTNQKLKKLTDSYAGGIVSEEAYHTLSTEYHNSISRLEKSLGEVETRIKSEVESLSTEEANTKKELELLNAKKLMGDVTEEQYRVDKSRLERRLAEIKQKTANLGLPPS
jgi:hypothetical protein